MIIEPTRPEGIDFEALASRLRKHGWAHLPLGLGEGLALDLLQDIHRNRSDRWEQAGIGRRQDNHINDWVRRDSTCWLDGSSEPQQRYLAKTAQIRAELNRRLLLGLFDYESHYARYGTGAFYRRHRDAFQGRSNRVLTTVAYLNPDWSERDGGELVLYDDNEQELARLLPTLGSLVIFLSEDFPHEVLPAQRTRFSIAGWYRRNNSIQGRIDPNR